MAVNSKQDTLIEPLKKELRTLDPDQVRVFRKELQKEMDQAIKNAGRKAREPKS